VSVYILQRVNMWCRPSISPAYQLRLCTQ